MTAKKRFNCRNAEFNIIFEGIRDFIWGLTTGSISENEMILAIESKFNIRNAESFCQKNNQ